MLEAVSAKDSSTTEIINIDPYLVETLVKLEEWAKKCIGIIDNRSTDAIVFTEDIRNNIIELLWNKDFESLIKTFNKTESIIRNQNRVASDTLKDFVQKYMQILDEYDLSSQAGIADLKTAVSQVILIEEDKSWLFQQIHSAEQTMLETYG